LGVITTPVRTEGLQASRGATDFGEYFLYFSFFLVVSALLLTTLFFKLGIEQRIREIGIMRAVGYGPGLIRTLFLGEGIIVAIAGSILVCLAHWLRGLDDVWLANVVGRCGGHNCAKTSRIGSITYCGSSRRNYCSRNLRSVYPARLAKVRDERVARRPTRK
jgi:hypothetical protein